MTTRDPSRTAGIDLAGGPLQDVNARLIAVSRLLELVQQAPFQLSPAIVPTFDVADIATSIARTTSIAGVFNAARQSSGVISIPSNEQWRIFGMAALTTGVGVGETSDLYLGMWPGYNAPAPRPATPIIGFPGPGPTIQEWAAINPFGQVGIDPGFWWPPGSSFDAQSGDNSVGVWNTTIFLHYYSRPVG